MEENRHFILKLTHTKTHWKCTLLSKENFSLEEYKILTLAKHKLHKVFNASIQEVTIKNIPFYNFILKI
jgi:hypothetical protein